MPTIIAGRYLDQDHASAAIKYAGVDGEQTVYRERDHTLWHEMLRSVVLKDYASTGPSPAPIPLTAMQPPSPPPPQQLLPPVSSDATRLARIEARLTQLEQRIAAAEMRPTQTLSALPAMDVERATQRIMAEIDARIRGIEQHLAMSAGLADRVDAIEAVMQNLHAVAKAVAA